VEKKRVKGIEALRLRLGELFRVFYSEGMNAKGRKRRGKG
jgi:hypothetical protein